MKLSKLIEEGTTITAYCVVECGGQRDLDLKGMMEAYGPDFELNHFTVSHRLKCNKCGKFRMTIRRGDQHRKGIVFDTKGKLF